MGSSIMCSTPSRRIARNYFGLLELTMRTGYGISKEPKEVSPEPERVCFGMEYMM